MYASYGRQEFPAAGVPETDAYGNPRWFQGMEPDQGVPAGIAQMGRDDRQPRPAMKIFPGARKGELSFDGMGTQPVWMSEMQEQQQRGRSADSRTSNATPAGGRKQAGMEELPPRGKGMFPDRKSGYNNILGRTDGQYALPQPKAPGSARSSARVTPTGDDRHLANFQTQLQEDIYQRFRHIKDAFLAMDPDRKGIVDREAVVRLCTLANLPPDSAGRLVECFDASGTTVWSFNEFVAALRRSDYDDPETERRGVAGMGVYVPPKPPAQQPDRGEVNAAALVNPGERIRSKIPRDLQGRELQKKAERTFTGAGMRVEHAPTYETPQLRARILAVAFQRMDKAGAGRVGRGQLLTWAAGLPTPELFRDKLLFDQCFDQMLELTERQPDKRIALHDIVRIADNLPPSVLGGLEAALTPPPSAAAPLTPRAQELSQRRENFRREPSSYVEAQRPSNTDQPHYGAGHLAGPPAESHSSRGQDVPRFGRRAQ
jgi:hypothetical protein